MEALRDMGFRDIGPGRPCRDESVALTMHTPDGRPATVTFSPQNAMTNMRINIGPVHIGDEMLSRDVFRRVALNFGTLPRDYLPLEPTLSRRINHPAIMPPPAGAEPPMTLEGEGFRPGEGRVAPSLIHFPRHRNRFGRDRTAVRSLPAFHPHSEITPTLPICRMPLALRAVHALRLVVVSGLRFLADRPDLRGTIPKIVRVYFIETILKFVNEGAES